MASKLLTILSLVLVFSCNSKKEILLLKFNNLDNRLFNSLIDTNCIYVKKYMQDTNNLNSLFIQNENILINEIMPVLKFFNNGTFVYYDKINNFEKLIKPVNGSYKFYNDTIETRREFYSVQSGKYFSTSIFIFKDSVMVEKSFPNDNGIRTFYEKKCNK